MRVVSNIKNSNNYAENHKILLTETKEDLNKRSVLCSWVSRLNIVTLPILPKCTYTFSASTVKISVGFF